jgi:hypothetical protein
MRLLPGIVRQRATRRCFPKPRMVSGNAASAIPARRKCWAAAPISRQQIPVDFIVQDWQYWGNHGWGAYEWDLKNYPDPTNMIAELHTNHFKYMISVWSNPQGIVGKALAAMTNGLIPRSEWMDVYNPAVRSLRWKYMDQASYSIGADAWWQDATEPGDDGNSVNGVQCFRRLGQSRAQCLSALCQSGHLRRPARPRIRASGW